MTVTDPAASADDVSPGYRPARAELPAPAPVALWCGSAKAKKLHIDMHCNTRRPSRKDYYRMVRQVDLGRLCGVCTGSGNCSMEVAVAAAGLLEAASKKLKSAASFASAGRMRAAAEERDGIVESLEVAERKLGPGLGKFYGSFRDRADELMADAQQLLTLPPSAAVSKVVDRSAVALVCAAVDPPGLSASGQGVQMLVSDALNDCLDDADKVADKVVAGMAELEFPDAAVWKLLDLVPCPAPVDGESVAVFVERVWREHAAAEAVSAAKARSRMLSDVLSDIHDVLVWCPFVEGFSWRSPAAVARILEVFVAEPVSFDRVSPDFLPPLLLTVPSVCADVLTDVFGVGVRVSDCEDFELLGSLAETVLGLDPGDRGVALRDLRAVTGQTVSPPRRVRV